MDTQRAGRLGCRRAVAAAVLLACVVSEGCVGPKAITHTRIRYNEVYRSTNDEQLLLNIVRLRYADSPVFIDLPTITSQFEVYGGASYAGGLDGNGPGRTNLGTGQFGMRDTPTLSYHPREGREMAHGLLTPLSAELLRLVNAGANTEQLLLMTVNDINDVPNAARAMAMTPEVADDNAVFRQGVHLVAGLLQRDAVELAVGTTEESEETSDPIPAASVQGRDVLSAAKDGYVYRAAGEGRLALRKREKGLVLRVRPAYLNDPEIREFERLYRLTPGLSQYRVKSELAEDKPPNPLGDDTIYLNMRSILQVAIFLSKGVCVPPEDVAASVAPSTPGPDGCPYDWTRLTAGLFFVHSGPKRPRDAEVAVQYRGHWFWIAGNDVRSRAVLAIFELLFALQESDNRSPGPLLTLPVGG